MNAPIPAPTPGSLREVELDDKYTAESGTVMISGTQALVRLPLLQREFDRRAGLNTAGYISGYRGSPIGGYDQELWRAKKHLNAQAIHFQPGLNEDLAATAIWGAQTLQHIPDATVDGVFGIWYGKGPGVDRSCDAFRHGNFAGVHPNGGVLVVAGDDHVGKSSTVAHQSELALIHCGMPVFACSTAEDVLDLGLLGFALSRYCGTWVGFTTTNEVLEQTMTVSLDALDREIVRPDQGELPPEGLHNRPTHVDRERSIVVHTRYRWPLIEKFVDANPVNRLLIDAPVRRLGIVSAGKAVQDAVQALKMLGLDEQRAADSGVSLYKLGCVFPVSTRGLGDFAKGQAELLFVEEKEPVTERQAKEILYGQPQAPRIVGKRDEAGQPLLPSDVQLKPIELALVIAGRLEKLGVSLPAEVRERVDQLSRQLALTAGITPSDVVRSPYFCSGCPHNSSMPKPDGSYVGGGIGCHSMAMYSDERVLANTQMGGEGAHWYSLAKFTRMPHLFQNMGDGTYYHSGILAIRGAVAAGVNITFRILYNDAVAMTGGQPLDGPISVGAISHQVLSEGAVRCIVVSDRPELYNAESKLAPGVRVEHRTEYDRVQRELREIEGVTVVIYEQTCAAEKRRRRKRGQFPDPAKRLFINPEVCEGCGDCSAKSNCVSLWPRESELGRKRQIDQSACNKDYSCQKGFCPSFLTIEGGSLRKPDKVTMDGDFSLPEAPIAAIGEASYNLMVSGIGGTGVVTVGALITMAAHLEGKACSVFDMTGLSQKNGAVFSHLRVAHSSDKLGAQRVGVGEADVALAFDAVGALSKEPAITLDPKRTRAVVNTRVTPTPAFARNPDLKIHPGLLINRFRNAVGEDHLYTVDATNLALALLGDTIGANLFLLGYASQLGLLPVSPAAIERAIEINGVAVEFNQEAFRLGRLQAADPERIAKAVANSRPLAEFTPLQNLDEIVAHRINLLTDYQNAAYSQRYQRLVDEVRAAEKRVAPDRDALSKAVARNFAKLMAYKDEYEVARLHCLPSVKAELKASFEGDVKIKYNLAPPLFAKRDPTTGQLVKREFGAWMGTAFALLKHFRFLRGSAFDIFGYSAERRMERGLIDDYEQLLRELLPTLSPDNVDTAVELASIPAMIRGYGHVKEASVEKAKPVRARLVEQYRNPAPKTEPGDTARIYKAG
ncbi:MAG: indolepyruvate ferredoxin oxidoreductase family protein [Pseudomonadota bacterium]|nr:indolepyruvate ferredoxin oxidoreductase family protein [Pseudomonadota bacterium]